MTSDGREMREALARSGARRVVATVEVMLEAYVIGGCDDETLLDRIAGEVEDAVEYHAPRGADSGDLDGLVVTTGSGVRINRISLLEARDEPDLDAVADAAMGLSAAIY